MDADQLWREACQHPMDWNRDRHNWYNWRSFVGPSVRAIWHTLTDEQKVAIATDAETFDTRDAHSRPDC